MMAQESLPVNSFIFFTQILNLNKNMYSFVDKPIIE